MSYNPSAGPQPGRGHAPAFPNHDFSTAAILSRARAHAAERAAELAAAPPRPDPRSAAEVLAAVEAGLVPAEPARKSETVSDMEPAALLADMARAIDAQAEPQRAAEAPRSAGRRLALFGAAAALLAPQLARPAAARVADADVALTAMGADLDRTLDGAAFAFDPVTDEDDQDRRLGRGNALQLEMAALPAVGLAGVLAKAKAYLDSNSYDTVNLAELADSLAEDAERVIGGLRA